jgi:hypothetical protein
MSEISCFGTGEDMKKTIIGFSLLLSSLILAWIIRDLMISTLIIPVILGLVQLGRIINTVPQIVWWIFLTLSAFSLLFINIKLPEIRILGRKKMDINRGRMDTLNSLINETLNSSTYSGRQLSLLLVNFYLKDQGSEEITIHKLEDSLSSEKIPDDIKDFIKTQYRMRGKQTDSTVIKLNLEKAVKYLSSTIIGDSQDDRSSKLR